MNCTAKRPATKANFRDLDHPDAILIKLHQNDRSCNWYECPHCGCVAGKKKPGRKSASGHAYPRKRKEKKATKLTELITHA